MATSKNLIEFYIRLEFRLRKLTSVLNVLSLFDSGPCEKDLSVVSPEVTA